MAIQQTFCWPEKPENDAAARPTARVTVRSYTNTDQRLTCGSSGNFQNLIDKERLDFHTVLFSTLAC